MSKLHSVDGAKAMDPANMLERLGLEVSILNTGYLSELVHCLYPQVKYGPVIDQCGCGHITSSCQLHSEENQYCPLYFVRGYTPIIGKY